MAFLDHDETNDSGTPDPAEKPDHSDRPDRFDRTDKDNRAETEKPLDTADKTRAGRGTGDAKETNLIEKACGAVEKTIDFLKEKELLGFDNNKSSPLSDFDPGENSCQAGERISDWMGQDSTGDPSGLKESSKGSLGDFIAGVDDFCRNYKDMTSKKTPGPDKFFHCRANCEATQRGPGGELAAQLIGYGREAVDVVKNVVKNGMTPAESINDCRKDLEANRIGREAGRNGVRCYDACKRDWSREF
jgi:hypothetical protein